VLIDQVLLIWSIQVSTGDYCFITRSPSCCCCTVSSAHAGRSSWVGRHDSRPRGYTENL
jgi:hypothetical protein